MKNDILAESVKQIRRAFIPVIAFSGMINLLMLTMPIYMMQVFDRVLASQSIDTLVMLSVIAVAAVLTMALLEGVRSAVMTRIGGWMSARMGGPLVEGSIADMLMQRGDHTLRGLRDLETVRNWLTGSGVFPLLDAPWVPVFLIAIFMVHPYQGVMSLIGALVLFGLALANELLTRQHLAAAGGAQRKAQHQAELAMRNSDVISAMGMLPNLVARWREDNTKALALQGRASDIAGRLTACAKFCRMGLQLGIMGLGAWLAVKQEISPGSMIAASILMGRALAPVEQAIGAWKGFVASREAWERISAMIARSGRDPSIELPPPAGRLMVQDASVKLEAVPEPILKNVSFALEPGEVMGLIGPSAAGKTTLARLLVGSWRATGGHVRLDGADMHKWSDADRSRYIGYLPQDVELMNGSVQENIARLGEADDEAVVAAAKLAGVHELILQLSDGYETQIGDGGVVLSGGQRQRVALARALFGEPRLLVLDEPNSSLDREGELALLTAVDEMRARGSTIVIIAHRPNILQHVDRVLVLREGRVDLFGERDEVMEKLLGPQGAAQARQAAMRDQATPTPPLQPQGQGA